ncbi:MAG TPA: MerC domain-containing protein [Thermoanaerobaculia bacterium]|nr:MerC domain-containing protein [Thermoanaerobaculia bacterium]
MHPQTAPIGLAPAESPPAGSAAVDRLGRWSSALALGCALHCLAMPLVLTFLPLASTAFRLDHGVERLLVGASALLGSASLCWGFRRHRRHGVLLLLAVALAAIAAGLLATHEPWEAALVTAGTAVLAAGHLLNRRLCRACSTCR